MSEETRVTSRTGGQKGTKLARFGLIPVGPLWELAELYGRGAAKYSDDNWRRGYDWHLSYDAMMRHAMAFWGGEDYDNGPGGTDAKHIICAAWHAITLAAFMTLHPDFDDRPGRRQVSE